MAPTISALFNASTDTQSIASFLYLILYAVGRLLSGVSVDVKWEKTTTKEEMDARLREHARSPSCASSSGGRRLMKTPALVVIYRLSLGLCVVCFVLLGVITTLSSSKGVRGSSSADGEAYLAAFVAVQSVVGLCQVGILQATGPHILLPSSLLAKGTETK